MQRPVYRKRRPEVSCSRWGLTFERLEGRHTLCPRQRSEGHSRRGVGVEKSLARERLEGGVSLPAPLKRRLSRKPKAPLATEGTDMAPTWKRLANPSHAVYLLSYRLACWVLVPGQSCLILSEISAFSFMRAIPLGVGGLRP